MICNNLLSHKYKTKVHECTRLLQYKFVVNVIFFFTLHVFLCIYPIKNRYMAKDVQHNSFDIKLIENAKNVHKIKNNENRKEVVSVEYKKLEIYKQYTELLTKVQCKLKK